MLVFHSLQSHFSTPLNSRLLPFHSFPPDISTQFRNFCSLTFWRIILSYIFGSPSAFYIINDQCSTLHIHRGGVGTMGTEGGVCIGTMGTGMRVCVCVFVRVFVRVYVRLLYIIIFLMCKLDVELGWSDWLGGCPRERVDVSAVARPHSHSHKSLRSPPPHRRWFRSPTVGAPTHLLQSLLFFSMFLDLTKF